MDIQNMKVAALTAALSAENKCGNYAVEAPGGNAKLECSCYQLTRFEFSIHTKLHGEWRYWISSVTESAARAFLYGAGLKHL